jgi:glyoxylase-like metal-dependent hydrolase (beta-lactamase superfamily II)
MSARIFFCLATGLAVLSAAADQPAPPQASPPTTLRIPVKGYETTQLGPGYYTFRYLGIRNIFLVTRDGVIATDPISPEAARVMREEIRKVTDLPVKYVVYSHQHWDHVRGGKVFKDEGAKFVSHANCVKHFRLHPEPDIVMPDVTFEGSYSLRLGGRTLELTYLGPNHGDCLVLMRPDGERNVFIVDLATAGGMPLPNMPDYDVVEWIRSLRQIEAMDFDGMVGGHGVPVAPKSAVTERRAYLEALMAAVKHELDAGTPVAEIPRRVKLPEFAHLRNYEEFLPGNVQRVLSYYGMGW